MNRPVLMSLLLALILSGCASGSGVNPGRGDGGRRVDARPLDSGGEPRADAAAVVSDGGGRDAGRLDGGSADAGGIDAGRRDAGLRDGGPPDVGPPDAGCEAELCNAVDDDCDGRIDESAGCPCPVRQYRERAYLFCNVDRSWVAARSSCRALGYDLVVLEEAAEDDFVYAEIRSTEMPTTWTGLNDIVSEGDWVWLDGLTVDYRNWDTGEPNDSGSSGEDCGVIMVESGRFSFWDDRPCDNNRAYVCEGPTL